MEIFQARVNERNTRWEPGEQGDWFDVDDEEKMAWYQHNRRYETRTIWVDENE